jgi:hypothetical protein
LKFSITGQEGKSFNTGYCLIEVITWAGLTILRFMSMHKSIYTAKPEYYSIFNMTHYWVMRIASWVILSNLCAKQTAWLFTDTETIFINSEKS